MPLLIDLEADLDEVCADVLSPWSPLVRDDDAEPGEGEGIDLETATFAEVSSALARSEQPVRALRIVGCAMSLEQLATLLHAPRLARLEVLAMPMCRVGPGLGRALVDAPLPRLRLLDLRRTAFDDEGARTLASSALGKRLEHLCTAGTRVTVEGLRALLGSALGAREGSLHVEEDDASTSLVASLMPALYRESGGDAKAAGAAFERLLAHPALTDESREGLRYQWDLVMTG